MNQRHPLEVRLAKLRGAPRCLAKTKTRPGGQCQCPAIRGRKRCRIHGGLSPGAPPGPANPNYKTGEHTNEAIAERRWLRSLAQDFAKKGSAP